MINPLYSKYLIVVPYFLLATIVTFLITPLIIKLAWKLNVVRWPPSKTKQILPNNTNIHKLNATKRRLEKPALPEWGGIAYIAPFIVISFIGLIVSPSFNIPASQISSYIMFASGIILLFITGIIDDYWEIKGHYQLLMHVVAALLLALSPSDLLVLNNPFSGGLINLDFWHWATNLNGLELSLALPGDLIIIGWTLLLIMPIKAMAGTDGLMEGNMLIASLIICLLSVRFQQFAPAIMSAILAGNLLGFLYYNFHPARIMSGSSGKSVVGFIIAGFALISGAKLAVTFLLVMIPVIDFSWVVCKRIFKHKIWNPLRIMSISDQEHLHHQLLRLGYSEKGIAFTEYSATLTIGIVALLLTGLNKAIFILGVGLIMTLTIVYLSFKKS